MRCGVLALQGDFAAHGAVLARLGVDWTPVRTRAEIEAVDALVLPGGESTTMLRLLGSEALMAPLADRIAGGAPTLATCAGVVLLARRVVPEQASLGLLDAAVERNGYGRQVHSTVLPLAANGAFGGVPLEGVFIRAPRVREVGQRVEVLARRGEDPVLLRQGRIVAATFHPELTADDRVHRLFLDLAR